MIIKTNWYVWCLINTLLLASNSKLLVIWGTERTEPKLGFFQSKYWKTEKTEIKGPRPACQRPCTLLRSYINAAWPKLQFHDFIYDKLVRFWQYPSLAIIYPNILPYGLLFSDPLTFDSQILFQNVKFLQMEMCCGWNLSWVALRCVVFLWRVPTPQLLL